MQRLEAIKTLMENGWPCGLRFDPIIFHENFSSTYKNFFQEVFTKIDPIYIHSVTLGAARIPISYYRNMQKNTRSRFLASLHKTSSCCMGYLQEKDLIDFCQKELLKYLPEEKIFVHTRN